MKKIAWLLPLSTVLGAASAAAPPAPPQTITSQAGAQTLLPAHDCMHLEAAALDTGTPSASGGQHDIYLVRHTPPQGATLRSGDILQIVQEDAAAEGYNHAVVLRRPLASSSASSQAPVAVAAEAEGYNHPALALRVERARNDDPSITVDANGAERAPLLASAHAGDEHARIITLCRSSEDAASLSVAPAAGNAPR